MLFNKVTRCCRSCCPRHGSSPWTGGGSGRPDVTGVVVGSSGPEGSAVGGESGESSWCGPAHVVSPAELLEGPNQPGGDVELPAVHAVAGAGGVGVVLVVRGVAHREHGQGPEVGGVVASGERP